MTWHHIIPYCHLKDAWNTLEMHAARDSAARNALNTYIRLLGFAQNDAKDLVAKLRTESLTLEEREKLKVLITYPPWDIVEGPSKRSDDPKTGVFDSFSVGLSLGELKRQDQLQILYRELANFNGATPKPGLNKHSAVDHVMRTVERTLAPVKTYIPFREGMWEMIKPGGVEPTSPGSAQWRKKQRPRPGY